MPVCTATRANYYTHNHMVLDSLDIDRVKEIALAAAEKGADFFCFKCANRAVYEEAKNAFCIDCGACYDVLKHVGKKHSRIRQNGYSYTTNNRIYSIKIMFKNK